MPEKIPDNDYTFHWGKDVSSLFAGDAFSLKKNIMKKGLMFGVGFKFYWRENSSKYFYCLMIIISYEGRCQLQCLILTHVPQRSILLPKGIIF